MTRAYREYVDTVTGEQFAGPKAGAIASGRMVTRKRANGKTVLVVVDREYVNDADPSYPVDRDANAELQRAAARLLQRRQPKRVKGVRTTFASARAAADALYNNNPFYAEAAAADPTDVVTDWMGFSVKHGRGRVPFARTKTGKQIREDMARRPSVGIKRALQWIIGQSPTRRWSDVDWRAIDEFNAALHESWTRARDSGAYTSQAWTSGGAVTWYPATSGRADRASLSRGEAQVVRTGLESDELAEIEEELVLSAKSARKCLDAQDRRVVNRRIRRIRWLLERPQMIADSGVCGEKDEPVCTYGSLLEEARQIRESCEGTYDPNWAVGAATRAAEKGDARALYDYPEPVRRLAEARARPTVQSSRDDVRSLRGALRRDR